MKKCALIETYSNKDIRSIDTAYANVGFRSKDYLIKKASYQELMLAGSLQDIGIKRKIDVAFGTRGFTCNMFRLLGVPIPKPIDYAIPERFYGRKIRKTSLKRVIEHYKPGARYFIKPVACKQFFSKVINTPTDFSDFLAINQNKFTEDHSESVWMSEVVDFVSEWRCYIMNGRMVHASLYSGDIRETPDWFVVDKMIESYEGAPVAYALDVGVLDRLGSVRSRTVCVELNDGWSLGNYGFDQEEFAEFLQLRWDEIVKPYS